MRIAWILRAPENQTVRRPEDLTEEGMGLLEITRAGDTITLRPVCSDWLSLADVERADTDLIHDRPDIMGDEGRFNF